MKKEVAESDLFMKYGTKICSYIWWAREAKIELTIQRELKEQPEIYKLCDMTESLIDYKKYLANPLLIDIPTYDMLVKEIVPQISHYTSSGGKSHYKPFHYYQSHHELIGPLLTIFGFDGINKGTRPADSILFELYKPR